MKIFDNLMMLRCQISKVKFAKERTLSEAGYVVLTWKIRLLGIRVTNFPVLGHG